MPIERVYHTRPVIDCQIIDIGVIPVRATVGGATTIITCAVVPFSGLATSVMVTVDTTNWPDTIFVYGEYWGFSVPAKRGQYLFPILIRFFACIIGVIKVIARVNAVTEHDVKVTAQFINMDEQVKVSANIIKMEETFPVVYSGQGPKVRTVFGRLWLSTKKIMNSIMRSDINVPRVRRSLHVNPGLLTKAVQHLHMIPEHIKRIMQNVRFRSVTPKKESSLWMHFTTSWLRTKTRLKVHLERISHHKLLMKFSTWVPFTRFGQMMVNIRRIRTEQFARIVANICYAMQTGFAQLKLDAKDAIQSRVAWMRTTIRANIHSRSFKIYAQVRDIVRKFISLRVFARPMELPRVIHYFRSGLRWLKKHEERNLRTDVMSMELLDVRLKTDVLAMDVINARIKTDVLSLKITDAHIRAAIHNMAKKQYRIIADTLLIERQHDLLVGLYHKFQHERVIIHTINRLEHHRNVHIGIEHSRRKPKVLVGIEQSKRKPKVFINIERIRRQAHVRMDIIHSWVKKNLRFDTWKSRFRRYLHVVPIPWLHKRFEVHAQPLSFHNVHYLFAGVREVYLHPSPVSITFSPGDTDLTVYLQWFLHRVNVNNEGYSNEIVYDLGKVPLVGPLPPMVEEIWEGGYVDYPFASMGFESGNDTGYLSNAGQEWLDNASMFWDVPTKKFDDS